MPPKKIPKYSIEFLKAKGRAEIQQIGRDERDAGYDLGVPLSSATDVIIDAIVKKVKVVEVQDAPRAAAAGESERAAGSGVAEFSESNAQRHGHASSTKVDAPSRLVSEPSTAAFRLWQKEVKMWQTCNARVDETVLVSRLLTCLADGEKELVLSVTFGANVTCDELLKRLQDRYGGSLEVERQSAIENFRTTVRGSRSLQTFLSVWQTARAQAVEHGVVPEQASEQDVWDLLKAAQISTTERAQVLRELELRQDFAGELAGPEKFNVVKKTLKSLALSFEMENGGKKKEEKSVAVLIAEGVRKGLAAQGLGKGKASKKGGDAKKDMACYECGKTGHFAADCWSKAKGKSKGQKKGQKGQKGQGKGMRGKGAQLNAMRTKAKEGGMKCWTCGKEGHKSAECPDSKQD